MFLYVQGGIQWTTGDASGGMNGLGGTPAQVGFNAGDGIRFASVPGSRTHDIINIDRESNVLRTGVFIFRVDSISVTPPAGCSATDSGLREIWNNSIFKGGGKEEEGGSEGEWVVGW